MIDWHAKVVTIDQLADDLVEELIEFLTRFDTKWPIWPSED